MIVLFSRRIRSFFSEQKKRLISLTIIVLLVCAIALMFARYLSDGNIPRMIQGRWIEAGDGDFLTTIEFMRRGSAFEANVYTSFKLVGNELIPVGPASGRPWGSFDFEASYSYDTYLVSRSMSSGAFYVTGHDSIVLNFSHDPPGRATPYMVETLEIHVTRDTLTLGGASGSVTFTRALTRQPY